MEMILLKDINDTNQSFENIKHIDENGIEFWYARELMPFYNIQNGKISKKQLIKLK